MSSQTLSSSSSSQRKQQTISSFFTKKPSLVETKSLNKKSGASDTERGTKTLEKDNAISRGREDEDEDEVTLPSRKRARVNGFSGSQEKSVVVGDEIALRQMPLKERLPSSSNNQTDRFRFTSSPVDTIDGEQESERQQKEKDRLHQKFVKRLGGVDCIIGIGRTVMDDNDVAAGPDDIADGDENEEPTPPPTTKGRSRAVAKKSPPKLTPMEKQVIDIRSKHMDTLLIIEVGYKFRFFGEDAKIAAKELGIVCIPGKLRFDEHPSEAHLDRFASASIPVHRLHVHVKRLVAAGYKVGVVRQIETAALKAAGDNRNAPFIRKLTNVYTKGTYIDETDGLVGAVSEEATPATGYLLCITETSAKGVTNGEKVLVGIVAVQPATGDIIYDEFEDGFMRSEVETRLLHIAPCELLIVGELSKATEKLVEHLSGSKANIFGDRVRVERTPKSKTAAAESHSHVSSFYAKGMKAAGGLEDVRASELLDKILNLPELVTVCLSSMIKHLSEYDLDHVFDLTKYFQSFSARSHMLLNGNTLTSLEIYRNQTDHSTMGSLFWSLDRTKTRFGQRLLRKWVGRPLLDRARLEERVVAVEELQTPERATQVEKLKSLLGKVKSDLEKSLIRIYYGKCTRPELLTVLQALQMIASHFSHVKSAADAGFDSSAINEAIASLPTILDDVVYFLNKINMHAAKSDDKYSFFRESEETEDITDHKFGIATIEFELQEHCSVIAETLKKKKVEYTSVAGIEFLVEVENNSTHLKQVPASWAKVSGTKKVSRFHTPEVTKLMRLRDQHKEALAAACDKAFTGLLDEISTKYQTFRDCIQALAVLDCLVSLAVVASQPGYVKPRYTDSTQIIVKQGRHPTIEKLLLDTYVPNDIDLRADRTRALLVTGPNMGGKSSYVRQVALIAIMGQIGSYVPARSATLGMLDAVFTRMGAFDNMMTGESTFMVELSETADILKQATPRSLVILDELGRGTSTHDGVAIAQAVLDHMVRSIRSLTLFITHYQHLSSMTRSFPEQQLRNVHMRFTESRNEEDEEITFLYELGEGVAHRSYGLNVARLANLPTSVLDMAKQKSTELEKKIKRKRLAGTVMMVKNILEPDPIFFTNRDEGLIGRLPSAAAQL